MHCKIETTIFRRLAVAAAIAGSFTPVFATDGMMMEGYGPISTGMGGVSQAIEHGNAAMAQNPATLALMSDGARLDIALGYLGPKVASSVPGMNAPSGGTSYFMPAVGFTTKSGGLTYGVGMFAQGGMGTEYDATTFLAAGSGAPVRSELGVGKLILPIAYQVNPNLSIGATVDFMWANLDLLMAAPGAQLGQLVTNASGNLANALGPLAGAPWARINFSDGDKNTGSAKGNGFNAKIGAVYKLDRDWIVGGSYQFKSSLSDMKTASGSASMTATGGFTDSGTMTVIDFQWPAITAVGANWQATPTVQIAADIKSIAWSDVMKSFKMQYESAGMGGSVSFALPQNWKDQTVVNLGLAYAASEQLTLRAGLNLADNPVPDSTVNPLFPATVKNHYTVGLGYKFSKDNEFNMSVTVAPSSDVTSGAGIAISHSQTNAQLMYTQRF